MRINLRVVGLLVVWGLWVPRLALADSFGERWFLGRGNAHLRARNYPAAVEAYEKVLTLNPRHPVALKDIAEIYSRQGLSTQAADVYERYAGFYPDDAQINLKLADLLLTPDLAYRRQDAAAYFGRSMKHAQNRALRMRYAEFLGERKETSLQAAAEFESFLKDNPRSIDAHLGAARAYAWRGQLEKAREHAQAADAINPEREGLQAFRKRLETGTPPDGLDPLPSLELAFHDRPYDSVAALALAQAYFDRRRPEQAIATFETSLKNQPNAAVTFALAEVYYGSKDPRQRVKALPCYALGLQRQDNWRMRLHYADLLVEQNRLDEAMANYQELLRLDPASPEVHFGMARVLAWKGQAEQAYEEFKFVQKAQRDLPGQAGFANLFAAADDARLETDQQHYAAHPDDPASAIRLAQSYERTGSHDRALDTLNVFLSRHPNDADVLFAQAGLIEVSSEPLRAMLYYDQGLEIRDDPAMRSRYAQLLLESPATLRDAAQEYEQALKLEPGSAKAHWGAGRAYQALGDEGRALAHARRSVQLDPDLIEGVVLYGSLREGRETRIGMEATFMHQPGTDYALTGFTAGPRVDFFPKSSVVATAQAGLAYFKNKVTDEVGTAGRLGLKYLDPSGRSLEGSMGWMKLASAMSNPVTAYARYGGDEARYWKWIGFQRDFVYDSMLSLVGETVDGRRLGEARSNLFFGDFGFRVGRASFGLRPFFGWIQTGSLDRNPKTGGAVTVQYNFVQISSASTLGFLYDAQITHYGQDHSGFTPSLSGPLPGGYFSPDRFIENVPQLVLNVHSSRVDLRVAGGPSFQYVIVQGDPHGTYQTGSQGNLSGQVRFSDTWQSTVQIDYKDIATVYQRVGAGAMIQYLY
jgi:tetratricopeptide (TPR) repeat protein